MSQKRQTELNFLPKLAFTIFFRETLTKQANNVRKGLFWKNHGMRSYKENTGNRLK